MASRTHAASALEIVARKVKRPPHMEPFNEAALPLLIWRFDDYPRSGLTTIGTSGLAAHPRSIFRRKSIGFELTATTAHEVERVRRALIEAVVDDLAAYVRGDAHRRVGAVPPRGIMHNGAFQASRPPHLVFTSDISFAPDLMGRHLMGDGYMVMLAAIPITDAELAKYDASPIGLLTKLRAQASSEDFTER